MDILTDPAAVRRGSRRQRTAGRRIGFVPTMGALHEGHLSLVRAAQKAGADHVVVSIFVNPTQFSPGDDLDAYPRRLSRDAELLEAAGVQTLFAPPPEAIYARGAETRVLLDALPHHLCGLSRPTHFGGVATVVALLLNIVEPDIAVFGEKDFQQLQVIRRMTTDLHFAVQIVGAPIIREPDGLAMSSRNAYLNPSERKRAAGLYTALTRARAAAWAGETDAQKLSEQMYRTCEATGDVVEYAVIVDAQTLQPVAALQPGCRGMLAVRIGQTRLIDNMEIIVPKPGVI